MVSAFVGQGRPGRDEGPSQREPALGRRPSTGRPRARTGQRNMWPTITAAFWSSRNRIRVRAVTPAVDGASCLTRE